MDWIPRFMRARCCSINVKSKTEHGKFNGRRPFPFSVAFIDYLQLQRQKCMRSTFPTTHLCVSMAMRKRNSIVRAVKISDRFILSFCLFFACRGACALRHPATVLVTCIMHANIYPFSGRKYYFYLSFRFEASVI